MNDELRYRLLARFMTEEECFGQDRCGCGLLPLLMGLALVLAVFCCCSRATYDLPYVERVRTEYIATTDTVEKVDSIIKEHTVVIREADSATMARYGIALQEAQRAWLVESREMKHEIARLRESKTDTVTRIDSIPYPVEVVKEKKMPLSWWQHGLMGAGVLALLCTVVFILTKLRRQ